MTSSDRGPLLLRHHKAVVATLTGAVLVLGAVAAADDPFDDAEPARIEEFEDFDDFEFEIEGPPEFEFEEPPEFEFEFPEPREPRLEPLEPPEPFEEP